MTNPQQTRKSKRGKTFLPINEQYPGLKKINKQPPFYIIDNFLTDKECDDLIQLAKSKQMIVSEVVNENNTGVSSTIRQSNSLYLPYDEVPNIRDKAENLVQRKCTTFEDLQVTKYTENGFYKAHYDSFDPSTEEGKKNMENGGQRIATILIYLNKVEKGGGTYFPKLKKRFIPKKGRAILFFPASLDGKEENLNLHRAEKVHGEKWVSQIWVRQNTFTS